MYNARKTGWEGGLIDDSIDYDEEREQNMNNNEKWLQWAIELQSLGQAGLTYGKDVYDLERYERIREIAAEMVSYQSEIPVEKVKDLFCNETGYQTPKIDTRAAIFEENRILLVKEKNGTWSLPGGWCDVNVSVGENTVKEVKEEAGLEVVPEQVIAIHDRNRHNHPIYAYGVCKIFVQCKMLSGEFEENNETIETRYFALDEIQEEMLAREKNTKDQIQICFEAYKAENWKTILD